MAKEKHQPSTQPTSTPTTRPDLPNIEKGSNSMPIYQKSTATTSKNTITTSTNKRIIFFGIFGGLGYFGKPKVIKHLLHFFLPLCPNRKQIIFIK